MAVVDFYILPNIPLKTYLQYACRLIENAYLQKNTIYIHVDDKQTAKALDDLLWVYADNSFIPHQLYEASSTLDSPVQIGFVNTVQINANILLNLTQTVPTFYASFHHILELVVDEAKEAGRQRYRFYQAQHLTIKTHHLQTLA